MPRHVGQDRKTLRVFPPIVSCPQVAALAVPIFLGNPENDHGTLLQTQQLDSFSSEAIVANFK